MNGLFREYQAAVSSKDTDRLSRFLEDLDSALAVEESAPLHHLRGLVLDSLERPEEALNAQLRALTLDERLTAAHYSAGLLLSEQGREADAIRHWERAVQLEPDHADAHYNLGQAFYNRAAFTQALGHWETAHRLLPEDFAAIKKIVQAQRALERWDDANNSMARLFEVWQRSADPAVRELFDVAVDQFTVIGHRVLATEMLRPRDSDLYYATTFHVLNDQNQTTMTVQLESSQYGRERGAPYLIGINTAAGHQSVGPVFNTKPSYESVKEIALQLITAHLTSPSSLN